jgi:hypothetical protein
VQILVKFFIAMCKTVISPFNAQYFIHPATYILWELASGDFQICMLQLSTPRFQTLTVGSKHKWSSWKLVCNNLLQGWFWKYKWFICNIYICQVLIRPIFACYVDNYLWFSASTEKTILDSQQSSSS